MTVAGQKLCLVSELASSTSRRPGEKLCSVATSVDGGPQCGTVFAAVCWRLVQTSCANDLDIEYNLELHDILVLRLKTLSNVKILQHRC